MDFAGILIIPLAAIVAAVVVGLASALGYSKIARPLLGSFLACFLGSVILTRPWEVIRLDQWPFLLLSAMLLFAWVGGGTVMGAALGLALVKGIKRLLGQSPNNS